MTPSPITIHQKISRRIYDQLAEFLKEKELGELFYSPLDVVLSDLDVVQPDLLFISRDRLGILTEKNIRGAPDLVIEILSPSTKERDLGIKRTTYERYGVREYWIVDPEAQQVEVLKMTDEGLRTHRVFVRGTQLNSPLLKELKFPIDSIFRSKKFLLICET